MILVNNSVPAIDPANPTRPVTMKLMTKVSSDPVIRQVTAFTKDRRCASKPWSHFIVSSIVQSPTVKLECLAQLRGSPFKIDAAFSVRAEWIPALGEYCIRRASSGPLIYIKAFAERSHMVA
jgi:hypothetical protein